MRKGSKGIRGGRAAGHERMLILNKKTVLDRKTEMKPNSSVQTLAENRGSGLELAIDLLDLLNTSGFSAATVNKIIARLKKWSGCETVGVRLWDDNAVPFFGGDAAMMSCDAGSGKCTVRECSCGDVVCGETELFMPLISGGKSFWTNSAAKILKYASRAQTRLLSSRRCEGYESVALIPLRAGKETFGLLQVADKRKQMFTVKQIKLFEKIAGCLAAAIARIKAVEALRRSEQEFREVIGGAREGVILLDTQFRYCYVNDYFANMLGYTTDELIGCPPAKFVVPRYRQYLKRILSQRRQGKSDVYELVYRRKDGAEVLVRGVGHPRHDHQGQFLGSFALMTDVTEIRKAEESLKQYARRVTSVQEEERARISRDLHDGVIQTLSSIRLRAGRASHVCLGKEATRDLATVDILLKEAMEEIRRISNQLSPRVLHDLGLASAVGAFCEDFKERTGTRVNVRMGAPFRMSGDAELGFFRIIQEAMSNVEKHSGATAVSVGLSKSASVVKLTVVDNGKGFVMARKEKLVVSRPRFGLLNIRERVRALGGEIDIESEPGKGTRIAVRIPASRSMN